MLTELSSLKILVDAVVAGVVKSELRQTQTEGNTYQIDPWIFSKETIELTMKSWVFDLSDQDKAELKKCQQEGKDLGKKLDSLLLYKPTKTNHDKGVIISYVKSINPN